MGTRCNIIIKEGRKKYTLYHHLDGYPEGIGRDLKEFLDGWKKWDWYGYDIANALVKRTGECVNYEISDGIHGDIEYLYIIDCIRKTITCYERKDWNVYGKDIERKDWIVEI